MNKVPVYGFPYICLVWSSPNLLGLLAFLSHNYKIFNRYFFGCLFYVILFFWDSNSNFVSLLDTVP